MTFWVVCTPHHKVSGRFLKLACMLLLTILNISAEFHPTHPLEFSTVMQALDFVSGLHCCFEFSQPLSCLYLAMQTRKTFSPGVILFTPQYIIFRLID